MVCRVPWGLLPLAALLLCSPVGAQLCGDCDGNGFVTILDALQAARHDTGLATIASPELEQCNVSGTPGGPPLGVVSVLDGLTIAQYAVGLHPQLLCLPEGPVIEYRGRYDKQPSTVDHLLAPLALGPDRALIGGTWGLALLDLGALPVGGTTAHLDRKVNRNIRSLHPYGDFIFMNEHPMGNGDGVCGFTVCRIVGDTIQPVTMVEEPGVIHDKMCIAGDLLYVAAHRHGLRVYDILDPTTPTEIGRLETGFVDAFDVCVDGTTAYVADGGGGLKVVDVTDPTGPVIVDGETLATATGTSEAVTVRAGQVYVAACSAGLNVYDAGDLSSRTSYPIAEMIEDLGWAGDYLLVCGYYSFHVIDTTSPYAPIVVAEENLARREANGILRLGSGIAPAPGNRLLVASWNYLDVYELVPRSQATQPDIDCTHQRIRFPPGGGTESVTVSNDGAGPLTVTGVTSTQGSFSVSWGGGTIQPGGSITFDVTYNGSPTAGSAVIRIASDDPDENPLPIQVFGTTTYLDPGEAATDFTLPILRQDAGGAWIEDTFTLSAQGGKVVWFAVYGSW
jgi:hypothetical protein